MHVFVMDVTYKNIALQDEGSEQADQYFSKKLSFFPFLIFFRSLISRLQEQNIKIYLFLCLSLYLSLPLSLFVMVRFSPRTSKFFPQTPLFVGPKYSGASLGAMNCNLPVLLK